MAAQHPNFVALSQHLTAASVEIGLIPNAPLLANANQMAEILQQLGQKLESLVGCEFVGNARKHH